MLSVFLCLVITLLFGLYIWQEHKYNYWKRHNIKYIKPKTFFGNFKAFLTLNTSFFGQIGKFYNEPGFENEPFVGIYIMQRPALLIRDLELVKTIMIKKFNQFSNRVLRTDSIHDTLGSNNLFFALNPTWRDLRSKISPVFSSGKIKQMYPMMTEVGKDLETKLASLPDETVFNVKDISGRLTCDLIATTAFGVQANSLKQENSDFYVNSVAIFKPILSRAFDFAVILMLPSLATLARVTVFSKKTTDFLRRTITHVLTEREKTGATRNDLIDILVAMKKEAAAAPEKPNPAHNLDYLVAQAAFFQTAGFETSASTMTFALYELANHPEMQERLRKEILEAFGDNDHISYEDLQKLPYLEQITNETLRKYAIVGQLEREYTPVAGSEPLTLAPYSDFVVPPGMPFYVSMLGIQLDPKYWPNPEQFDPERFAPENKSKLNMDAYMPFGIGPHNCIGMRLGLIQSKLGLVHLFHHHRVSTCSKTLKKIEIDPLGAVYMAKGDIYLKLERIG